MGEHTGGTATFKKQNDGVRNVAVGRERAQRWRDRVDGDAVGAIQIVGFGIANEGQEIKETTQVKA